MIAQGAQIGLRGRSGLRLAALTALVALVAAMFGALSPAQAQTYVTNDGLRGRCMDNGSLTVGDSCNARTGRTFPTVEPASLVTMSSNNATIFAAGVGTVTVTETDGTNLRQFQMTFVAKPTIAPRWLDSDGVVEQGEIAEMYIDILGIGSWDNAEIGGQPGRTLEVGFRIEALNPIVNFEDSPGSDVFYGNVVNPDDIVTELKFWNRNEYRRGNAAGLCRGTCGGQPMNNRWYDTNGNDQGINERTVEAFLIEGPVIDTASLPLGVYLFRVSAEPWVHSSQIAADGTMNNRQFDPGSFATVMLEVVAPGTFGSRLESVTLEAVGSARSEVGKPLTLQVNSFDAEGVPINPDVLTSIQVIAPGASISAEPYTTDGPPIIGGEDLSVTDTSQLNIGLVEGGMTGVPIHSDAAVTFTVQPDDSTAAATLDVYVILQGSTASGGRVLVSNTVTVSFSGPVAGLTIQEPAVYAPTADLIYLTLNGIDSEGSVVTLGNRQMGAVAVTDANGATPDNVTVAFTKDLNGDSSDDGVRALTLDWDAGVDPPPGVYTLTAQLNDAYGGEATKVSSTITISGSPAQMTVDIDASSGTSLGSVITATITVQDAGGNPVAPVPVNTSISGGLTRVGSQPETVNGVTTRSFVVTAEGVATMTFTAGDLSHTEVFIPSALEAPAEEPVEEALIDGLSRTQGFATWVRGSEVWASELFSPLAEQGATAMLLWNGRSWVRYSVVNGTMVPGSSDYVVAENDILFVSY